MEEPRFHHLGNRSSSVHFGLLISHIRINQFTPITGKKNIREYHRQKRQIKSKQESCSQKGTSYSRLSLLWRDSVSTRSLNSLNEIKAPQNPAVLLRSHLWELCAKGRFQQHPSVAILGEVFKPGLARAHRPSRHCMEDPSPSTMCLLDFLAPGTQNPLPLASALTVGAHNNLMTFLLGTVRQTSCLGQLDNSYLQSSIRAISGPDHYQVFTLLFPWSCATTNTLFSFTWAHGKFQEGHHTYSLPGSVFWGHHGCQQVECWSLSLIQFDINNFLLRIVTYKMKITSECRLLPGISESQIQITDNMQGTMAQSFWNQQWLVGSQQLSPCLGLENHLDQQCSQHCWSLLCLYRESAEAATWVCNRLPPLQHQYLQFHMVQTQFLPQFQPDRIPQLTQNMALLFIVNQHQLLTENIPSCRGYYLEASTRVSNRPFSSQHQCLDFHMDHTQFLPQFQAEEFTPLSQIMISVCNVKQYQLFTQSTFPSRGYYLEVSTRVSNRPLSLQSQYFAFHIDHTQFLPQFQVEGLSQLPQNTTLLFNVNQHQLLTENISPSRGYYLEGTTRVSNRPLSSQSQYFTFHIDHTQFLPQFQAEGLSQLPQNTTLLFNVNQHQLLTHGMSPSLSQGQIQAQIPCSFQKPTCSSPSCTRVYTTNISTSQLKRQYAIPKENKCLEWPLMKQRVLLPFILQKAQETTGQVTCHLPQGSQATPSPKLVTMFSEYFLRQTGQKPVPTQPSAPTSKGSRSMQETKSWCSDSFLKKGLMTFQLKDVRDALEQESEDQMQCLGNTSQNVKGHDSKYSESDFKIPEKDDLGIYYIKSLDKKCLQEHLVRKLGQLREGLVPIRVRKSWLNATHTLPTCHKHTKPRNLAYSKGQEPHVDTSQEPFFLVPKSCLLLEEHIKSSWLRCGWEQQSKAPTLTEVHVGEATGSPSPQPAFPGIASWDSWTDLVAEIGTTVEANPQTIPEQEFTETPLDPVGSPLPALSGTHNDMQSSCSDMPAYYNCGPSVALPTAQQAGRRSSSFIHRYLGRISTAIGIRQGTLGSSPNSTMASNEPQKRSEALPSEETCHSMAMQEVKVGCQPSMINMFGPTKKTVYYNKPREKEQEETHAWERSCHAFEPSPLAQSKKNGTLNKFFLSLLKKKPAPTPSKEKKNTNNFLKFLKLKNTGMKQEELKQNTKLPSIMDQWKKSNTKQRFTDGKKDEAQIVTFDEEMLWTCPTGHPPRLPRQKPVSKSSCYDRISSG